MQMTPETLVKTQERVDPNRGQQERNGKTSRIDREKKNTARNRLGAGRQHQRVQPHPNNQVEMTERCDKVRRRRRRVQQQHAVLAAGGFDRLPQRRLVVGDVIDVTIEETVKGCGTSITITKTDASAGSLYSWLSV